MADLAGLIRGLEEAGALSQIVNNPMAQFGTTARNYIGAQLLPDRPVTSNRFTVENIKYRTVVANDATRYSPVQLKGSSLVGSMKVELGTIDIGSEMTAQDYDAIINLIEKSTGMNGQMGAGINRPTMTAEAMMLQFFDRTITRALADKREAQRWQAIDFATVQRTGDDGYAETVNYPNPAGHRVAAGGAWSGNYDPYNDIMPIVEVLKSKGYTVNRIVSTQDVRSKLALNSFMKARTGKIVVNPAGNAVNQPAGRATDEDLRNVFGSDGLPSIELNDYQYANSQTTTTYFKSRGTMTFFATTDRDESIDRGDLEPVILGNTLGFQAIGRATGEPEPGLVAKMRAISDRKPYSLQCEGWGETLPIIEEPEAIAVITGIA